MQELKRDRRVLVTGASGFIGCWAVKDLLARGYEVHAVHSGRAKPQRQSELDGATLHAADLFDPAATETLVTKLRPSHLLHFAWIATPGLYWTSPDNLIWVEASLRLLRGFAAGGGKRLVMAGSCAEYDWSRAGICSETETPLATDGGRSAALYAASKVMLSKQLFTFAAETGISAAWGRIFFPYGPYEHPNRLVPSVITALLKGVAAECTSGSQVRDFLHSTDLGGAFAALLDSAVEGAINLGSGERVSVAELAKLISSRIGRPELLRLGAKPTPAGEPPLLVPDLGRMRRELSWKPRFTLEAGIDDAIAWWRGQTGVPDASRS
jgi:nucleoside-diphosphate-sugar epimerase